MATNTAQILYHDTFDSKGFTNENSLQNALLTKPDQISPVITHLAGREDNRFPLTFMTEGQKGGYKTISVNDVQYEWNTFSRLKTSDEIVSTTYSGSDTPGIGNGYFYITFRTNWLKNQHTVQSPNGISARIMNQPTRVGSNYTYALQLTGGDPTASVPLSELIAGTKWGMVGGASVSESLSMGNESNVQMPGKMKNQISILRKSYHLAGNVANRTVEVQFNIEGKTTSLWSDFETWQHMLNWKQSCEENYWYSEYNRLADGSIALIDEDSGLPIPMGAGIFNQIPNKDTYSVLTAKKIKNTVSDVMYGATDTGKMNVVLYTGEGGAEEFDSAMKDEASGFSLVASSDVGNKFVTGAPGSYDLVYGAYFTTYRHVDGHTITVKKINMFDHGGRAEIAPKHPVTGKSMESYRMVFLDQSMYDGEPNVLMMAQKGRGMVQGVVQGMAKMPGIDFKGNANINLATEQDKSSWHVLSAKGVNIRRANHCFELSCDRN